MDPVPEHGALPDEKHATAEELAEGPGLRIGNPDGGEEVDACEFGDLPGVDGIDRGARLPDALHVVRVGDHDAMAQGGQRAFEPVPRSAASHLVFVE
jgi:hypothetical protein